MQSHTTGELRAKTPPHSAEVKASDPVVSSLTTHQRLAALEKHSIYIDVFDLPKGLNINTLSASAAGWFEADSALKLSTQGVYQGVSGVSLWEGREGNRMNTGTRVSMQPK